MTSRERAEHERQVTEFLRTQGAVRSPDENEVRDRRIARIESEHFDEQDGRELISEGFRVVRSDLDPRPEFDFDEDERAEIERCASKIAERKLAFLLPELFRWLAAARSNKARDSRIMAVLVRYERVSAIEAAKTAGVSRQAIYQQRDLFDEEVSRISRRIAA